MAITSSLLKTLLHKTIADGLYKEVQSRNSRYYYFLGKTINWEDEQAPPFPTDSYKYELATRNEMITLKEIKPSDVAFVVPRIDWVSGTIYDIYDDQYSTEVIGLNLTDGGGNYTSPPDIVIGPPNLFGGVQATAVANLTNGSVTSIDMVHTGSGYTNPPQVSFINGGTSPSAARAVGVLSKAPSNSQKLEDARFYIMTDEYNVYKCIDNNNNAKSTSKPIGTQVAPITLADGYIWKYMFNVPIALRTKFLTNDQMPVITALTEQFYSAGGIESVIIQNRGMNYTQATISVTGDGYLEADPVFLTSVYYTNRGTGYSDGDDIIIAKPIDTSSSWLPLTQYYYGTFILSSANNIYEVVQAGTTSEIEPTHHTGTVLNGSVALKFAGSIPRAYPSFNGSGAVTVNLLGSVKEVNLTDYGYGYTSNPPIKFTPPTLTFSGTGVNTGTETITLGAHWFMDGDRVTYKNGGGTTIPGLVNNTTYWIIKTSSTTVKLASTYDNAMNGIAVNLTGAGVGSSHTLSNELDLPQAFADLSPTGIVKRIIITDPGNNYPTAPTVTIGNAWTASTTVSIGQQYFVANRLYTVTGGGTTGTTAPVGTNIGVPITNGTATLIYAGHAASGEASLKYGAGYNGNPSVSVSTTTGSGFVALIQSAPSAAKLIPLLENGQIVGVQVDNPGVGYSTAKLTVSGDGTLADLAADIAIGNINTLQANNELLTVDGSINNIQVVSQGYGYGTATISVEGDGTGLIARASLFNGKVVKINIVNAGSGYTWAKITINGNGFGATARAIISPFGGHGKSAFEELFARTLMFYSNVSLDKNQGFDVNNDYRQVGIIKNLRGYGVSNRYDSALGSACFVVEGNYDPAQFTKDMLLTTPRIVNGVTLYKNYRVISTNAAGTGMLIQMLDNDPPQVSDLLSNPSNQYFTVTQIGNPTVDKYSGDLLFIDNKAGFTPSADESVTLRTVVRF